MAGFQQTIIIGNVGQSPTMRYTQGGTAVCSFSVAVSESWTDATTKEKREKTNWYRCTGWNAMAETLNQYVKKGNQIMIVGNVEANAYMNNQNQPAASLDLTIRSFQFLGGRNAGDAGNAPDDVDYDNIDAIPF